MRLLSSKIRISYDNSQITHYGEVKLARIDVKCSAPRAHAV